MLAPGSGNGGVVVLGALSDTTVLAALGGEATSLAVLVDGVDDPVDAGVATDGLVRGVDKDDLVVGVDTVGVDPVRVQDAQVAAATADTLLSEGLEATLGLEVVDTLADGLAVGGTLGGVLFAVTATNTDTVDNVSLLGLVAETAGLVGARGTRGAVDNRELAVLPAANARDELENVRLLLGVQLSEVLVGTHLDGQQLLL